MVLGLSAKEVADDEEQRFGELRLQALERLQEVLEALVTANEPEKEDDLRIAIESQLRPRPILRRAAAGKQEVVAPVRDHRDPLRRESEELHELPPIVLGVNDDA